MQNILTLTDEDGKSIQFLTDDAPLPATEGLQSKGGLAPAGRDDRPTVEKFAEYFDPIRRLADQLAAKIDQVNAKPSEVEVTVGVKLSTKAGVVFASAGADAQMTVKMKWKTDA